MSSKNLFFEFTIRIEKMNASYYTIGPYPEDFAQLLSPSGIRLYRGKGIPSLSEARKHHGIFVLAYADLNQVDREKMLNLSDGGVRMILNFNPRSVNDAKRKSDSYREVVKADVEFSQRNPFVILTEKPLTLFTKSGMSKVVTLIQVPGEDMSISNAHFKDFPIPYSEWEINIGDNDTTSGVSYFTKLSPKTEIMLTRKIMRDDQRVMTYYGLPWKVRDFIDFSSIEDPLTDKSVRSLLTAYEDFRRIDTVAILNDQDIAAFCGRPFGTHASEYIELISKFFRYMIEGVDVSMEETLKSSEKTGEPEEEVVQTSQQKKGWPFDVYS